MTQICYISYGLRGNADDRYWKGEFTMDDCIFCKIVKGEIPAEKIQDGENFIIINDVNPVSEGHCLIISKEHYETIFDLPSEFGKELVEITKLHAKRLIDEGKAEGINIVNNVNEAAGQIVNHFHIHIVPRKKDDGLKIL